ncbi:2OG-Fe dioxygenase family protein [Pseudomonas capsici]|uniref:2OG-Fe dioxygenase family protein n=1 Tax=Pseudomonas capsici TaxID=2810614 RepID=UPI000E3C9646|nr:MULTISPECIES: 2OG-Fe dioxygenase family protein [Pseudomonas]MBX8473837.1 2OG-Fe dioxygenase family protein [Pseudomonas cichorii]MBX8607709.1 2OG-Fe dioxygenase family protein [Pseudomonas cichorii]MBX8611565.1 2OG-Fe dioxygenase family protein [Pseudomonas cichorii]MCV4261868.1 2OG-Fe dioxygenase family protein [Pseudomonas capsici]MCV4272178.1 2OG-Fe dioxygenase family protein [Pseudomonas capsici]
MLVLNKEVGHSLQRDKFANVLGSDFSLYGHFADFIRLTKSWENMEEDKYYGQADSGMRFRRYSDFEYNPVTRDLRQLEHRAYVQSTAHNRYVGGLERHFQDFSEEVIASPVVRSLIDLDFEVYKHVLPPELHNKVWQCQIHQIRIEIKPGKTLEITPEGIHCDGYPFSGVHFWGKQNVEGAQSRLYNTKEEQLAALTYDEVLDTTFFLDREMRHYVTPASNRDPHKMAYRQIMAISFSLPGTSFDIVR